MNMRPLNIPPLRTASVPGLTLRDYFAGQALAGVVVCGHKPADAPARAYEFADAMLAERAKGGGK